MIFFDLETHTTRPGCQAPPIVCGAWRRDDGPIEVVDRRTIVDVVGGALVRGEPLAAHTASFDMICTAAAAPELLPWIFAAYRADRIYCTMGRQKLIDIAHGKYRGMIQAEDGSWDKVAYTLESCAGRIGIRMAKGADTWRLRYGELDGIPITQWPAEALEYVRLDVDACTAVFAAQEAHGRPLGPALPQGYLEDQHRRARADWWLRLMSTWGIITDERGVDEFEARTRAEWDNLMTACTYAGLIWGPKVRGVKQGKPGSRNTTAAKARCIDAYALLGKSPPGTEKGDVSLSADTCIDSGDEVLIAYGRMGEVSARLSKDLPLLRSGVHTPIHTRVDLAESGRVITAKPNVQNVGRKGGVRECFVPRPGKVYARADYGKLELCTLAQYEIDTWGSSRLAEALNAGRDPHLEFACGFLGITYEEGRARMKAGDPEIINAREAAKPANFGYPGGLGIMAFIAYAKSSYGVVIDPARAPGLKRTWQDTWGLDRFLAHIGNLVRRPGAQIIQPRSNRVRGDVGFTDGCNTIFQGFGADVAQDAGFAVAYACYVDRSSPLYGCRIVNFVHDEFILECDPETAHEAALELSRIMVAVARVWLPNVTIEAEPMVCARWSKEAYAIKDANGRLIPWDLHHRREKKKAA